MTKRAFIKTFAALAVTAAAAVGSHLPPNPPPPGPPPTDAFFYDCQWNLRQIDAPGAWDRGYFGSPKVKVAVLDTGIDPGRFELTLPKGAKTQSIR